MLWGPGRTYWGFSSRSQAVLGLTSISLSMSLLISYTGKMVALTLSTIVRVISDGPLRAPSSPPLRTYKQDAEAMALPVLGGGLLKMCYPLATGRPCEHRGPRPPMCPRLLAPFQGMLCCSREFFIGRIISVLCNNWVVIMISVDLEMWVSCTCL